MPLDNRPFNWHLYHTEKGGTPNSSNRDNLTRPKAPWYNASISSKIQRPQKKDNSIENRVSAVKTNDTKKKFGSFMGGLLLKRNSDEGVIKKPEPKVLTEKLLKQKVLTEEPYLDLFRVRKNRFEQQTSVSPSHPIKKARAIKFSLKLDDQTDPTSENSENIVAIVKNASEKHRIVNGKRTRWDVRGPQQESVSALPDRAKEDQVIQGACQTESKTCIERESPITQGTTANADNETCTEEGNDDNDDSYSIDSLQSDDDVLGPWIELGMIEPAPSDKSTKLPAHTDCQQCIENSCADNIDREPLQTVNVCSSCQFKWKDILGRFSEKFATIGKTKSEESRKSVAVLDKKKEKLPENLGTKKNQSNSTIKHHKLSNIATSAFHKRTPVVAKKARGVKLSIPPTKSRYSQKTNRKIMVSEAKTSTNTVASSNKQSLPRDKLEDHFTTGAFMTRKTAKTLADPEFGFYPNPHGFVRHQRVEVLNINGYWYRGTLEMMNNGKVMVKYNDWDDQEWIIMESRRLRSLSKEEEEDQIVKPSKKDISDKIVTNLNDVEKQDNSNKLCSTNEDCTEVETLNTIWSLQLKPLSGAHKKSDDDYISHALDKDPTQIFNNNEVFMTRRMARELADEYGFKPNLFGYRRNRAVAITFHSKKKDGRKIKEECVGYLREMHQDQIRVWYPHLHISEWLPAGSRRLRVMTEEEEEAILFDNKVDLDLQEVPHLSLMANDREKFAQESNQSESNTVNDSLIKDKTKGKAIDKGTNSKTLVKRKIQGKVKKTAAAIMEAIKGPIETRDVQEQLDKNAFLQPADSTDVIEAENKDAFNENVITDDDYLTTGAFATRRAMRQLKDKNGFTPNTYGYTCNQAVEILNTRSGKAKFWERGRLVAMRPGQVKVHYDGWVDEYDEWMMVGSRRIRIVSENELDDNSTASADVSATSDAADKSNLGVNVSTPKSRSTLARNQLLMAEKNPELNDEAKKNRKHQIVLPQDYHRLGLLVNLDEEAMKESQKKERREKRKQNNQTSVSKRMKDTKIISTEEYIPETSTLVSRKPSKKQKLLKSTGSAKRKRQTLNEMDYDSQPESSCCTQLTTTAESSNSNDNHIISLRLAQAKASQDYKFVANVYGYDYMQHVTVLHLDKKLYEGRLIGIYKNKVKVHYCGWLDAFDEYITLGSRRLQPIENDHEVVCIEPNYRERYEQMQLEQPVEHALENTEIELHQEINKRSRKRLTLDDMEDHSNCGNAEEVEVDVESDACKVFCHQCSVVIKQFRYYCTYCETPQIGRDYESFELCLRCFDHNFPFWHEHPRSSFAIQAVIDSEIGPMPIKGELVTVWEEDILEDVPVNGALNIEQCPQPIAETINLSIGNSETQTAVASSTNELANLVSQPSDEDRHLENGAIDASKVFSGNIPIETDQGYKYLKRWKRRKVCAFCNDDDDTSEELGAFIGPFVIATFNKNGTEKKRSFWAHDACARYSPEVFCTPEGKWYNVTLALRRGRGMRCHGCKEKGATIGCFESKCSKSYHLPCAQKPVSYFKSGVIFWCSVHEAYYNKKDTYVNKFSCDGCSKELVDESWFTCVPCASSYFSSFDLCTECYEKFPTDHAHNEDQFEETSFAIIKEMEAQKATEAAKEKEDQRATNAKKKKKSLFPRRRRRLADGSMPVSCCYCGTYEADSWRKGYDGGVIMCNPCFELALLIDNDGKSAETGELQLVGDHFQNARVQPRQHEYAASIEDYSHKPYLTRDALSSIKFSEASTGSRLASYEPQPNQLFSLTFDSTYFDIPGRAPRWATHSGTDYHGTWLPQTVRRAILKHTSKDERVLSNFLGRGTDAIECFLLQRKCCGVDINPAAVALSQRNCCFEVPPGLTSAEYRPIIAQADSRELSGALFGDESYHHVLSHPPYKDCVAYSTHLDGDLSRFTSIEDFKIEYAKVVQESYRLLKMSRRLTLGIGDNREHCFYIPVGFHLIRLYIDQGFELEELVIKRQRYCSAFGLGTYLCVQFDFLVFTHEFIATFKKLPKENIDKMPIKHEEDDAENISIKRITRGIPPSAIMRKSVVMGTVWIFKPTQAYKFSQLCISRMVERFGRDDCNWEHIELTLKDQLQHGSRQDEVELPSLDRNAAEVPQQEIVDCPESTDPLSEYEQQRLKRIEENNKTLLKLGLISELSEDSDDVVHCDIMMNKVLHVGGSLALMVTGHIEGIPPKSISAYRQAILRLATEAAIKLARKGMLIIGTQDIRDPVTGKLWPMTMLVLEDIETELGRDIIRLKEMVVTVPDGYSKDRKKDFPSAEPVQEEEEEEEFIDIETIDHGHIPIVHAVYLVFQKL